MKANNENYLKNEKPETSRKSTDEQPRIDFYIENKESRKLNLHSPSPSLSIGYPPSLVNPQWMGDTPSKDHFIYFVLIAN